MIIEARALLERWKLGQIVRTGQPPHVTLVYNFDCKKCAYRTFKYLRNMKPTYALINGADLGKSDDGYFAYFKVEPSHRLMIIQKLLTSVIKNYTSEKDYEYSVNNFWHVTIKNHTSKREAKRLTKKYKNFVYPLSIIRITYIEDFRIWREYDLLERRVYRRGQALRTRNWSRALPLKNPLFRIPEEDDEYYTTYVIADNHFGHEKIIKYSSRPFSSVKEMDEYMIDEWNSVVSVNDTVIHLGGLVFKGNPKHYLRRLHGKIYLVPGNHDDVRVLEKHGVKILDDRNFMQKLFGAPPFTNINGVAFSHYPRAGRVFGHVHTNNLREYPFYSEKGVNACAEVVNYRPIPLDKVLELLNVDHK